MRKRIIYIITAALLLMSLWGCGKMQSEQTTESVTKSGAVEMEASTDKDMPDGNNDDMSMTTEKTDNNELTQLTFADDIVDSPNWVTNLPQAKRASQLFVIAAHEKTTAWISLHEKDENGNWKMIMTTPGFIGKNGLGKTKEGDGKTPVGEFSFNRAFGINDDPGCAIPYVKVDDDKYWSGDSRDGMHYNELVDIKDYPELNIDDSEHIIDYKYEYRYCLNISYNDTGTAGAGSAIFLHCFGNRKPYTGGCVAIPMEKMRFVMEHVSPDCVVVIDTLENMGGEF